MSHDQNDVPVGNILNSQQAVAPIQGVVEQPRSNPREKLKQYYLHQRSDLEKLLGRETAKVPDLPTE